MDAHLFKILCQSLREMELDDCLINRIAVDPFDLKEKCNPLKMLSFVKGILDTIHEINQIPRVISEETFSSLKSLNKISSELSSIKYRSYLNISELNFRTTYTEGIVSKLREIKPELFKYPFTKIRSSVPNSN